MSKDYLRTPLDDVAISHLVSLLRRGHQLSIGDRGLRQLAFNGQTFVSSLTDRGTSALQAEGMNEAQLRERLSREPRHLYDAFIVGGLVREGHQALMAGSYALAAERFEAALESDYKEWAPLLGLGLLAAARHEPRIARDRVAASLVAFPQPLYHYALMMGLEPRRAPGDYIELLNWVIEIDPSCSLAYRERADALARLGAEAQAAEDRALAASTADGGLDEE